MSDYITLLNSVDIADSPNTYLTVKYAYERDGADVLYKLYFYSKLQYTNSYRNDGVSLTIQLDDTTVLDSYKWKANSSGGWPISYTATFRVKNKTSGTTKLYFKMWDSQGTASFSYTKTFTNLIVPDAFPILTLKSVTTELNKAELVINNSITGNITDYELVDTYDNDKIIKSETKLNTTSLSITLTPEELMVPGLNYSGRFKIRAYANGGWGDYLLIESDSFVTKSLPTGSVSDFNINTNPIFKLSSMQFISDYYIYVYDGDISLFNLNTTSQEITLSEFSNFISDILNRHTSSPIDINIKFEVNIISNSNMYPLPTVTAKALLPNDLYNPIFNTNNITYEDVNDKSVNITGSKYKIIKGLSDVKFTITPMSPQYGAIGKSYNIVSGSKLLSLDYSNESVSGIIYGVDTSTYNIQAIDSRNKSTRVDNTYSQFINYENPELLSANINRNNGVDTNLNFNLSCSFYNWNGLEKSNTIKHVYYRYYDKKTPEVISDLIEITSKAFPSTNTMSISDYIGNGDYFDIDTEYIVEILVEDLVGLYSIYTTPIPTAKPLIWKDKLNKFVGINKKPERALDVEGTIRGTDLAALNGMYTSIIEATRYIRANEDINALGYLKEKGHQVTPIDITDTTASLLDRVKELAASGIKRVTWFTQTDEGTSGINDKPSGAENKGFVCEAICNRYYTSDDWRYVLRCYVHQELSLYIALVDTSTTSINWIKEATLAHPVGSIFITSTNTNPNSLGLSGTWELIDKGFKSATGTNGYTRNTTNCTEITQFHWTRSGHSITLNIRFTNKVQIADNALTMFTVDYETLGITRMTYNYFGVFWSDLARCLGFFTLTASSANFNTVDMIPDNYISAGRTDNSAAISFNVPMEYMLDNACDKFYWKRIS